MIAQKPETAAFQGMPRSAIGTGIVDLVLPPEEMSEALLSLASHSYVRQPAQVVAEAAPEEQLRTLLSLVRIQTKRDFSSYKKATILRRVHRRMGLHRIDNLPHYLERLRNDPDEIKALAADLTINVTGFFRDPEAWDVLAEQVIAPLVRDRPSDRAIRVWVPGCSTGEEAYSIAMLLIEQSEAVGKSFDVKLFATDVADSVLPLARAGQYPSSIALDVGEARLERFFELQDDVYKVKKALRELITFAPQSLLQDPPFSHLDLISCRNLLIYIEAAAQRQVLGVFHFALQTDGHLFLGPAENVTGLEELFQPVSKKWRIYRRLGPTRHDLMEFPIVRGRDLTIPGLPEPIVREPRVPARELLDQALVERYALASVLIDQHHRVHYFRGPVETYLGPPSGEPTHNLLAIARPALQGPLRAAINKAVTEGQEVVTHANIQSDGVARPVQLVVTPLKSAREAPRLMVSFSERAATVDGDGQVAVESATGERQLQHELDTAREDLRLTVEQLEVSNEELKASNEEIRSINEELQASNEELETSKEELQSLNEELNTVNNQLQAKVSELERHTNDLNNLLNGTDIATLFLDRQACIRWFTPAMRALLELLPTDIGRPVFHLAPKFKDGDLAEDAKTVLAKLATMDAEVMSEEGRWFLRRMVPYRTDDDRIDGVVVTFTDITDRKKAETALRASEQRLRKMLDTDAVGVVFFDASGTIIDANPGFLHMTGYSQADVEARELTWRRLTPPEWLEISEQQMERLAATGLLGPYEKEYFVKDGSRTWILFAGADLGDGSTVEFCIGVGDRKRAEAERELLTRELSHRVKNMFAVVQALATQSGTRMQSVDMFREAFLGRLLALAKAHDLLLDIHWRGADLQAVVEQAVAAFQSSDRGVIEIKGEPVALAAQQSLGLALVLHELGTNAVKHGSLSRPRRTIGHILAGGRRQCSSSLPGTRWPADQHPHRRRLWHTTDRDDRRPSTRRHGGTRIHARGFSLRDHVPDELATSPPAKDGPMKARAAVALEGHRVLVVEDEALVAMELADILERHGCTVIGPAGSVAHAHGLLHIEIDAALLDLNLHGELSISVAVALNDRGVPFAILSGYGQSQLDAPALRLAPRLSKPVQHRDLLRALEQLLNPSGRLSRSSTQAAALARLAAIRSVRRR